MAGWRDSHGRVTFDDGRVLIGATFRGVPFFVDALERSGGRRTTTHEYPLRDQPFIEDLGRKARRFPVEGYVLGADYVAQRDRLLAALEEAGPGELRHPTYGTRRVICSDFRVRESTSDGGLARFALEFEETESAPSQPVATVAAAERVAAQGEKYVTDLQARLALRAEVSLPVSVLTGVAANITAAAGAMRTALSPLAAGVQELARLKRAIDQIILEADTLAREPTELVDGFVAALEAFRHPVQPPAGSALALLAAYAFSPPTPQPPATTATRIAEREVYDLTMGIIGCLLVAEAARAAVGEPHESYDAAVAVRDAIAEAIDAQAEAATDDETFAALEQLRADLVRALPGEESDLPRLREHVPAFTVPSLVLAHRLYGDLSREADLVARNRILRPGFIVGGTSLEILADA